MTINISIQDVGHNLHPKNNCSWSWWIWWQCSKQHD